MNWQEFCFHKFQEIDLNNLQSSYRLGDAEADRKDDRLLPTYGGNIGEKI